MYEIFVADNGKTYYADSAAMAYYLKAILEDQGLEVYLNYKG